MNKRALMLSAAVAALLCGPALADTTINTKTTSSLDTGTSGNITITTNGSIVITTSPPVNPAVELNSTTGAIVNNEGTISYDGVTGAVGIKELTGYSGMYESTGKLNLTGSGTSKVGIEISGPTSNEDSGTFTGVIPSGGTRPVVINLESGSTTEVQGDSSVGIEQMKGTNIVGDIDVAGTLDILPTSANSTKTTIGNVIAMSLAGTMTGNLNIQTGGIVEAFGQGAEGIEALGNITGAITNQGTIEAIGSTKANSNNPNASLPQAGTALVVSGSVSGGIYNAGPSTVADSSTARATITSVGNASTVVINPTIANASPTGPLTIGAYYDTTDPGYSFLNRGSISDSSADPNVGVTTFSIVGASTTAPTVLTGGLFNGGSITSAATTNTTQQSVDALSLLVGNYAVVPRINNSNESGEGTITATVSGPESGTATAIEIASFANESASGNTGMAIINSGTISATATTTNPQFVTSLTAYAIYDQSGSINSITNSGTISATATTLKNNGQVTVAADLSNFNSTNCQCSGVNFQNSGTVNGSILFGAGNDTLAIMGTAQTPAAVNGNVSFGGTSNGGFDTLTIGQFGTLTGAVTENLGSFVNVSIAQGGTLNLENTPANLGNNVVGLYTGTFDAATGANLGLVVSQQFNLSVSPQTGALVQSSQSATIGDDVPFKISFGSFIGNYLPGRGQVGGPTAIFDLFSAPKGNLIISQSEINLVNQAFTSSIPFLFTGNLCTWNVNGSSTCSGANPGDSQLVLNLTAKSAQDLGLTGFALKMFPYANQALAYDDSLGAAMLNNITNAQQAQAAYASFAPDVSGATRALAISLTDDATNVVAARQRALREYANQDGDLTMWTQEFVERLNQDTTTAGNGYTNSGFGFVLGADEGDPEDGRYGGAFTFFSGGADAKAPLLQKTSSDWYMLTGYTDWHGHVFFLDTQATVGYADLNGRRTIDLNGYMRTADSTRPAEYMAGGATAGVQYNVYGAALMPQLSLDGLAMRQESYTEQHGGGTIGDGFDLHVDPDYAASLRAFAGVDARDDINLGDFLFQPEARTGYRYDFANGVESVRANFIAVQPLNEFEISGPKPSPGNALAGGGLSFSTGAWSVQLGFDYLLANSGNTSEEGSITLLGRI